jgi:hypothetical protein
VEHVEGGVGRVEGRVENVVVSFQGTVSLTEHIPKKIALHQNHYTLAGAIYGDQIHAVSIIHKNGQFWLCNDRKVQIVNTCTTDNCLMIFYTLKVGK